MSAEQVWNEVKENIPFISGVTITGGEPTHQPAFLKTLLQYIKFSSSLTTCLETNGHLTEDKLEALIPYLDYVMVDLKAMTPALHHRITGKSNTLTCRTIQRLAVAAVLHKVRTTIVPGLTDSVEEIRAIAQFLLGIHPDIHFQLLRFRPHGVRGEAQDWASPSDQVMDELVQVAKDSGLAHVDHSL
jgi:pyruvate-formate lyase-activating enzyme